MEFYEHKAAPNIGFIPLVDVVFILLLFFILAFNFSSWRPISEALVSSSSVDTLVSTESEPEPELESKSEPKLEPELEPKAEPKLEPELEPELEPKAEVKPAITPAAATEPLGNAAAAPAELTEEEYVSLLTARLGKSLIYPPVAKSRNWQGEVLISIKVGKNGALRLVRVEQTSGHALLDQAAVDAVRKATPLPAPPVGYTDFVVPLLFALQ